MCVIIANKTTDKIDYAEFSSAWETNPHYGGIAYIDMDMTLQIHKFTTLASFWTFYNTLDLATNTGHILHFRITTHGTTTLDNTHPFSISNNLAVAHNGIIRAMDKVIQGNESDTRAFVRAVLKPLEPVLEQEDTKAWIAELITAGSKLALIKSDGTLFFINEQLGSWHGTVWRSNRCHLAPSYTSYDDYWEELYTRSSKGKAWYETEPYKAIDNLLIKPQKAEPPKPKAQPNAKLLDFCEAVVLQNKEDKTLSYYTKLNATRHNYLLEVMDDISNIDLDDGFDGLGFEVKPDNPNDQLIECSSCGSRHGTHAHTHYIVLNDDNEYQGLHCTGCVEDALKASSIRRYYSKSKTGLDNVAKMSISTKTIVHDDKKSIAWFTLETV